MQVKNNRFPGSLQFTLHAESTPLICTLATQFIPLTKSSSPLEKCSLVQKNFKQMCGWLQSVETPSTDQLHWGLSRSPLSPEAPDGGAVHQQPFLKTLCTKILYQALLFNSSLSSLLIYYYSFVFCGVSNASRATSECCSATYVFPSTLTTRVPA